MSLFLYVRRIEVAADSSLPRPSLTSIVTSRFLLDLSELAARAELNAIGSTSLGGLTLTVDLTPSLSKVPSVLFESDVDMGNPSEEPV